MSTAPTHRRRWTKRPSTVTRIACDAVAWAAWTAIVVGTIVTMLVVLELAR